LSLWHETTVLHLTENKQLEGSTAEDHQFAEWLLKVGRGQNNDDAGLLELPTNSTLTEIMTSSSAPYNSLCPQ
jgi:hypothetical protein